ncbi:unnamed protein product [Linum trigynum]|uniref:Uncharacterized protein n=1 Tax=Linum trigynum TaxID=586398 RepID=A0AAV2ED78_9ROSI
MRRRVEDIPYTMGCDGMPLHLPLQNDTATRYGGKGWVQGRMSELELGKGVGKEWRGMGQRNGRSEGWGGGGNSEGWRRGGRNGFI